MMYKKYSALILIFAFIINLFVYIKPVAAAVITKQFSYSISNQSCGTDCVILNKSIQITDNYDSDSNTHTGTVDYVQYNSEFQTDTRCNIGTEYLPNGVSDVNYVQFNTVSGSSFTISGNGSGSWTNISGGDILSITLFVRSDSTWQEWGSWEVGHEGEGYCRDFSSTGNIIFDEVPLTSTSSSSSFTVACSPSTQTITAGGSTSFNLTTSPQNGFSSAVNFSHGFSPSSGTLPGISYTNNNTVPSATTTANISTSTSTTTGTYTITFTGSGGGQTASCNVTLTINSAPAGTYSLSISPGSVDLLKGNSQSYTVSATCTGGLTGPITALTASSNFSNIAYSFSNTTVNCGSSVTLTITNTGAVPSNQLSTPQSRFGQTVTVTGTAY